MSTKKKIAYSNSSEPNTNIRIDKINDDFSYGKFGDFEMVIMNKNKYMNATKLCNNASKKFSNWTENSTSIDIITELAKYLNMDESELIKKNMSGSYDSRGSYVHPLLITHIACWCGPNFAIKISIWIEEWKKYSIDNELKYWDALKNIQPSKNLDKEKQIQHRLQKKLGGEIEVETDYGDIDLLTDDQLIEIKKYSDWKCAIGQLISYSKDYPDREKIMYLFDVPDDNIIPKIKIICNDIGIKIKKIDF